MRRLFIVTGAGGHLGNTLVRALLSRQEEVRVLLLPGDKLGALDDLQVETRYGDVCDLDSLEQLFDDTDGAKVVFIHAAGIVSISSKYSAAVEAVNVKGTQNIIKLCEKYNPERLIYVSSVHAFPDEKTLISEICHFSPDNVVGLYSRTKAVATQTVLDYAARGGNAVVVHPSGIIGPNDYGHGHLTQMIMDYLDGRLSAGVRGGYDFVDVRDVARGILAAVDKGVSGQCYILSGNYSSVGDLFSQLSQVSGKRPIKTMLPMWFAKLTAPLAEVFYKILNQPPLFTRYSLYVLSTNSRFSHVKATKELGYHPRPLSVTMQDTVEWLIAHNRLKRFKPNKHAVAI